VDVAEGQAMLAAARKYKRVVQVGLQRRSTPHLIEARNIVKEGKLGTIGDMGVHMFDMVRWFTGLRWPRRISSFGGLRVLKGGLSRRLFARGG